MNNRTNGTAETTDMMDYIHPDSFGIWLRYVPREPDLEHPRYVPFCIIVGNFPKVAGEKG